MTAATLPRPMKNYLEYSRLGFVNILAFRLRYYTGIVTYLINVTVYYFIWKALYATDPGLRPGLHLRGDGHLCSSGLGDPVGLLQQHRPQHGGGCRGGQDRSFDAEAGQYSNDVSGPGFGRGGVSGSSC